MNVIAITATLVGAGICLWLIWCWVAGPIARRGFPDYPEAIAIVFKAPWWQLAACSFVAVSVELGLGAWSDNIHFWLIKICIRMFGEGYGFAGTLFAFFILWKLAAFSFTHLGHTLQRIDSAFSMAARRRRHK